MNSEMSRLYSLLILPKYGQHYFRDDKIRFPKRGVPHFSRGGGVFSGILFLPDHMVSSQSSSF